jgi:hypothetical protein
MKCAVETGSGAVIYIQSFINTGSGIQNCKGGGGGDTHTNSMEGAYAHFYFSK